MIRFPLQGDEGDMQRSEWPIPVVSTPIVFLTPRD